MKGMWSKSRMFGVIMAVAAIAFLAPQAAWAADADVGSTSKSGQITFAKEVSRIVQNKCQACHRPEGVAPFSMMNYRQVRGWSKMIKEVVSEGRMPPWHADPQYGKFMNDRRLTPEEKTALISWIDGGMPQGNPSDLPEPADYSGAWKIGEPDLVFALPEEVSVDSTGVVPYMYFVTESNIEKDTYIQKAQALPGNDKVVHHIIVTWFLPEGANPDWKGPRMGFLVGTAPGDMPLILEDGQARLIPKGANLRWQMHYTPTGKVEIDRSEVGLVLADYEPEFLVETSSPSNHDFTIPPNDPNYEVEFEHTIDRDIRLISFMPHMHYRGKSFMYEVKYPDGTEEILLNIPHYDFNWQAQYRLAEPKLLPKGTVMHGVAHFDNSANNPYNPDPKKTVRWGDQTWEEMMIGWHDYLVPVKDNPQVAEATD